MKSVASRRAKAESMLRQYVPQFLRGAPEVWRLISLVEKHGLAWAIVGGAPRVWVLDPRTEPNDVDLVINASEIQVLEMVKEWKRLAQAETVSRTSFGGYRLIASDSSLDVWSASSTVGLAKSRVKDKNVFRGVSKSAALSLDSLVFTSDGSLYESRFFFSIETGILCLNHRDVEQPEAVVRKAIRLCNTYRVTPNLPLQALIDSHLYEVEKARAKNQSEESPKSQEV